MARNMAGKAVGIAVVLDTNEYCRKKLQEKLIFDHSTIMLIIFPCTLALANSYVEQFHRHHKPVIGHRFSIGCKDENDYLYGVAIVGRPIARAINQSMVVEVTRLCTNGTPNVCSKLYSTCAKIADAMGFWWIQTMILENESGISLKASGWQFDHHTHGGDWNCASRSGRRTDQPQCDKQVWIKPLSAGKKHAKK